MRRQFIKHRGDEPSKFANVAAYLFELRAGSRQYAVTNVDPVGVIEHFTFAEVAGKAALWSQLLRAHGLEPGDRVVVLAGREWEWRCALLGVMRAGGVAVPCPASLPAEDIHTIAISTGAGRFVSIPERPDLADAEGSAVVDARGLDAIDASRAVEDPPYKSARSDVALVLYARGPTGLRGAMHTHASLIAQAEAGEHWLGIEEGEPVWSTADDGSAESIWLLLAAWQIAANVVNVELELEPEGRLELIGKLGAAAVWFSDEEYHRLVSVSPAAWIGEGRVYRALLSDERSSGATAFANAIGAEVTAVFGLPELGVVAGWPAGADGEDTSGAARPVPGIELAIVGEEAMKLPAGLVGDVVVRRDAPSLISGYVGSGDGVPQTDWLRFGWRGTLAPDGALRLASRSPVELEAVDAEAEAEERRRREEEEARQLAEAAAAAEAARAQREAEERRREEEEARRRAEQEAKEREQAEAAARAEREAAEAEARRRAEEQRRREEEARRRAEQEAQEREQAVAAARAEREATEAEERLRAELAAALVSEIAGHGAIAAADERTHTETSADGAELVPARPRIARAEPRREPRALVWQLATVFQLLVIGALLAAYFLTRSQHSTAAPRVTVPSLVGLTKDRAVSRLKDQALVPHVVTRLSKSPAGTVFAQDPRAASRVKLGARLTLLVSAGELARVPDVVGVQRRAAVARLRVAGLASRVKRVPSSAGTGIVIQQLPASRTKVGKGSTISLLVSAGQANTAGLVTVPNVIGQARQTATKTLERAGFGVWVPPPSVRGWVVSQQPSGGSRARASSTVTIYVRRAKRRAGT
jgi:acyl-coenzyme A synthetase/AMP-(fatty) acid ligase